MTTTAPVAAAPDPLQEAIRTKLLDLVQGPLTPKALRQIEQTASLAKQLLAVGKHPMAAGPQRLPRFINTGDGFEDDTEGLLYAEPNSMVGSPKAETFGATVIREAVGAYAEILNRPRPTPPHEYILAIQYAKSHELHELAKRLEQQLEESLTSPKAAQLPGSTAEPSVVRAVPYPMPPLVERPDSAPVGFVCTEGDLAAGGVGP